MRKVTIDPKLLKKCKVHSTIIKRIAMLIRYPSKKKYHHNYPGVIDYEGSRYLVVYRIYEDDVIFIKQARVVRK